MQTLILCWQMASYEKPLWNHFCLDPFFSYCSCFTAALRWKHSVMVLTNYFTNNMSRIIKWKTPYEHVDNVKNVIFTRVTKYWCSLEKKKKYPPIPLGTIMLSPHTVVMRYYSVVHGDISIHRTWQNKISDPNEDDFGSNLHRWACSVESGSTSE